MIKNSSVLMVFMLLICAVACKKVSSHQDLEKITELEKQADASREAAGAGKVEVDTALLGKLGNAYLDFAGKYAEAPETPEFLFRAGELYSNELKNFRKAIEVFERNYKQYPEHETA
ncbi:MAG: hypothetical protein AAF570_24720, partial [Bacteroidota bacterium]